MFHVVFNKTFAWVGSRNRNGETESHGLAMLEKKDFSYASVMEVAEIYFSPSCNFYLVAVLFYL